MSKVHCNIWNTSHNLDLTAAQAISNVLLEEKRSRREAKAAPKSQHLDFIPPETKKVTYKLAWKAPELR